MSQGLAFFTTVPGMLISGGVLLLVIALVILLVQHKKAKKNSGEVPADPNAQAQPAMDVNAAQPMVADPAMPVAAMPVAQPDVVVQPMPAAQPAMDPTMPVQNTDNVVMPVEVPMAQGDVMPQPIPQTEEAQVQAMPQPQIIPDDQVANVGVVADVPAAVPTPDVAMQPVQPEVAPIAPEAAPAPEVQVVPDAPAPVEAAPAQPTIYGGADPSVVPPVAQPDNTPHQIYGGADPMENTQTMPSVQPAPVAAAPVQPEVVPQPQPVDNAYAAVPTVEATDGSPIPSIQSIN